MRGTLGRALSASASAGGSSPHMRGAPSGRTGWRPARRDHPRVCGSTYSRRLADSMISGSSPRMRGAQAVRLAAAGLPEDHPRIRGEHADRLDETVPRLGIIPAYAGSTRSQTRRLLSTQGSSPHMRGARVPRPSCGASSWDHPRIRGEHKGVAIRDVRVVGIIPAYAGAPARGGDS